MTQSDSSPTSHVSTRLGEPPPGRPGVKRSPTCVHCVVTRAVARVAHRGARQFTLCSCTAQVPTVAMDGPELYALVSDFFRGVADSSVEKGAVRIRIVSGAHPEIHIVAADGPARATRVRTLAVPRHANGTLMGGCDGFYGDDAVGA